MFTRTPLAKQPPAGKSSPKAKHKSEHFSREEMLEVSSPGFSFSLAGIRMIADGEESTVSRVQNGTLPLAWPIQTKLQIGPVSDPLEAEADRVADQVLRMPEAKLSATRSSGVFALQRKCDCGGTCDDCKEKDRREGHVQVRMKAAGPRTASGVEAPAIVHEVLRSPGQPLDAATRAFMEPRFGQDLSGVRLHSGSSAARSAAALQAKAYTMGKNVVFGAGEFSPGTQGGQRLLAHELAHVVQQENDPNLETIRRREVDDRSCAGLKDIESDIDAEVNKKIDEARKAAGTPMRTIDVLKGVVKGLGEGRISPIETFIDTLGSTKVKMPPSDLAGTKYRGAEAVNLAFELQKVAPVVLSGAALVHGICVGSDKLGHFFGQGADYWDVMHKKGAKPGDAESAGRAMEIGVFGLGEGTVQPASGVYSNADLAANLAGLKFYQALEANPKGYKFHIKDHITRQWNEQTNPSFYEAKLAGVVWSNLLNGTWKGPRGSKSSSVASKVDLTATSTMVAGSYEWPVGAKSPTKGTISGGVITLQTTKVAGQEPGKPAVSATPVSGISIQFDWNKGASSGKGQWKSKDEQTLEGTWGHGKAASGGGTWKLRKA